MAWTRLPWLGPNMVAVQTVSEVIDNLAVDALPTLMDATSLTHPTGIVEMYDGRRDPDKPSIHLRADGVLRSPAAKEYNAGTRMYGLKDSRLLGVMDMAAVGERRTLAIC